MCAHTHTHTHTHRLYITHTHTHTHIDFISHTHTPTHRLYITHTHTHTHPLTHREPQTHTLCTNCSIEMRLASLACQLVCVPLSGCNCTVSLERDTLITQFREGKKSRHPG